MNPERSAAQSKHRATARGFSLIELLVVIGIIGVLIGLLFPALAGARQSALQTVALSNVRQVGTQFTMHADQERAFPHQGLGEVPNGLDLGESYTPRGDELIVNWYPGGVIIATTDYFSHDWMWPSMVAEFDEWPTYWETWISPRKDQELPKLEDFGFDNNQEIQEAVSIRYSNSFVARPDYWKEGNTQADLALLRSTRPSDVRYPSDKVLLWDNDLSYMVGREAPERIDGLLDAQTPMAFADGHAAAHNPHDASDPVDNPLNQLTMKLHNTENGVHGRDY